MVFFLDLTAQGKAIEAKYKQLGLHQDKKYCTQKKRSYQQNEKSTYSTKDDVFANYINEELISTIVK